MRPAWPGWGGAASGAFQSLEFPVPQQGAEGIAAASQPGFSPPHMARTWPEHGSRAPDLINGPRRSAAANVPPRQRHDGQMSATLLEASQRMRRQLRAQVGLRGGDALWGRAIRHKY